MDDSLLRLGPRRYRKGIGTHSPSEIAYRLGADFSRLLARIGGAETNGTVVFQVFGDDKLLYGSPVMHGLREIEEVDVDLTGVDRLRLVVTDAGDGYGCDMANWVVARVLRVGSRASVASSPRAVTQGVSGRGREPSVERRARSAERGLLCAALAGR